MLVCLPVFSFWRQDSAYSYFRIEKRLLIRLCKRKNRKASPCRPNLYIPTELSNYHTVSLKESEIHSGELILVNSENEFWDPADETNLVCVFDGKTASYNVSDKNVEVASQVLAPLNQMLDDFTHVIKRTLYLSQAVTAVLRCRRRFWKMKLHKKVRPKPHVGLHNRATVNITPVLQLI